MKKQLWLVYALLLLSSSGFAKSVQDTTKITFGEGSEVVDYPQVQWIKGEPVTKFDKDKIYIVECWATWCGPCKAAIPHLNELHKKYGDKVIFIGQSVFENDLSKVTKFVSDKGDDMSYRVSYGGGKDSEFTTKWLVPAGVEGIPQTFVIQNNKIVWMPHPMDLTDDAINLLINHEFSKEKLVNSPQKREVDSVMSLVNGLKYDEAIVKADKILLNDPDNSEVLMFKALALDRSGKADEALAFLAKKHHEKLISGVQFELYSILLTKERFDELISYVNSDVDRALAQNNPIVTDVIVGGYQAYVSKKDYQGLATFINRVSAKTDNFEVLNALSVVGAYYPIIPGEKCVDDAIMGAARKLLSSNQIEFKYLTMLAQVFWNNGEHEYSKELVNSSLLRAVKDKLPESRINAIKKLSESMDKGKFPPEEQLNVLFEESLK